MSSPVPALPDTRNASPKHAARVLVFGSANMDLLLRCPRLPRPGETVGDCQYATAAGGKGANQAVAAARMGATVQFMGRIGNDEHGQRLADGMRADGIDVGTLERDATLPTGIAVVLVDEGGENSIAVVPGANGSIDPGFVRRHREQLDRADWLVCQLEVPTDAMLEAVSIAKANGARVLLNTAPFRPVPAALLRAVDVLVLNEGEAEALAGAVGAGALDNARALLPMIAGDVIVTLGARGALHLAADGTHHEFPAHRVQPLDTTGAGDTFVGAMVAGLAEGRSMPDAIAQGQTAAAWSVQRHGAQPSMPTRADLEL